MTEQETMQGLRACWEHKDCSRCPFVLELNNCHEELAHEAYKTIERVQAENAAMRERLSRAVELPVKIGDKVYMPWVYGGESGIAECEVYHIALFKDRNDRILIVTDLKSDNIDFKRKYNYGQFMLRDFGVKLFTAPEAALARLAELEGKEE